MFVIKLKGDAIRRRHFYAVALGAALFLTASAASVQAEDRDCTVDLKSLCAGVAPGEGHVQACIQYLHAPVRAGMEDVRGVSPAGCRAACLAPRSCVSSDRDRRFQRAGAGSAGSSCSGGASRARWRRPRWTIKPSRSSFIDIGPARMFTNIRFSRPPWTMRKVDGWQTLSEKPTDQIIDLAA